MAAIATGVPTHRMPQAWPALWPIIRPIYEKQAEKRDLLAGFYARELQLWCVWDRVPVAVIVTKLLVRTSGAKDCRIWLISGARVTDWLPDFIAKVSAWARAEGCTRLTASGRKGWHRLIAPFGAYRIDDEDGWPAWALDIAEAH